MSNIGNEKFTPSWGEKFMTHPGQFQVLLPSIEEIENELNSIND